MYKVGIIGNGFVGGAVSFGLNDVAEIRCYDKDQRSSTNQFEEVIEKSDFIFITVPTPSNEDGSQNLSHVEDVCKKIDDSEHYNTDKVIILKSTVLPGTTRYLSDRYGLVMVYNPEFLTARHAKADFLNPARIIIGGDCEWAYRRVEELYRSKFRQTAIHDCAYEEAEMIKYMCNCFFSTKISFLNEMKQISDHYDGDWDKVMDGFLLDQRIGYTHNSVPGPDGKLGFGGACFSKDINAMIYMAKELGINPSVLEGAWKKNEEIRPGSLDGKK